MGTFLDAIYLDKSFNAAHYLQSEDRIHRLGLPKDARPTVEFVECEKYKLSELIEMINCGKIHDAKTVIGILMVNNKVKQGNQ